MRRLEFEIYSELQAARDDLAKAGKTAPKDLAKALATRLHRIGYLAIAGTKEIFAEFQAGIDLVAWKTSFAQPVAVVIDDGLAEDRIDQLDQFNPPMLFKQAQLMKIFVNLALPQGVRRPTTLGEAYVIGLAPAGGATNRSSQQTSEPDPF